MRRRNARRTHLDLLAADFFTVFVHEVDLDKRKLILVFSWVLNHLVYGSRIVDGSENLVACKKLLLENIQVGLIDRFRL